MRYVPQRSMAWHPQQQEPYDLQNLKFYNQGKLVLYIDCFYKSLCYKTRMYVPVILQFTQCCIAIKKTRLDLEEEGANGEDEHP